MAYRYLGNKTRLVEWIVDHVSSYVTPGSCVADLMCGTASVSAALAERGFNVIAGDELRFPCLHATARLIPRPTNLFSEMGSSYENVLNHLNALDPLNGYFRKEFGADGQPANGRSARKYFTAVNAGKIDAIRHAIQSWRQMGLKPHACDVLLHDLVMAVNQIANISGTYGYFRSDYEKSSMAMIRLKPSTPLSTIGNYLILHGRVDLTVKSAKADLAYFDPPYTKRQYAGNYHILETIAREDSPEAIGDGGLRPWTENSSEFCYRRRALNAIQRVMELDTSPIVVWSYSSDGQVKLDDFMSLLAKFGEALSTSTSLSRFRSNNAGKSGNVTEYLLTCIRR